MNKKASTERGYVLLLAVLVSTIVMTLGTLIAGFVRHDLALAGAADESDVAFYAATSMMNCGQFYEFNPKHKGYFNPTTDLDGRELTCFDTTATYGNGTGIPSGDLQEYEFNWTTGSGQELCSILQVVKTAETSGISTRMIARGYNVPCNAITERADAVERVIEANY